MSSLRGRLTAGVLLVLGLLLLAAALFVTHAVDSSQREAFDDRLRRTAVLSRATAAAAVNDEIPEDSKRLDAVLTATNSSLRLRLGSTLLVDTGAPPPRRAPLAAGLSTFRADGRNYRAYSTSLNDPNLGGLVQLEVVSDLTGLEARERRLHRQLGLVALIGLALVAMLVWLVASLALRPLRRLQAITSIVAEDQVLTRRVPAGHGPAELRSLARSFNAMLARLGRSAADRERALEATRRFAADAGHELRTPLTSVQATLSALSRHPELDDARRSAMVADALAEQRRLVDLLDGLQALARGDAGPLQQTRVDLTELVDELVTATGTRNPSLHLAAELPGGSVVVEGWEPGLRMLIGNLVSNAARHGHSGGHVHVALLAPGVDGPGAVLHVDDDGGGVPADERERIFAPFARIDGTDRPGSGLGLALVAQQARHHDADVDVTDAPLGGARFTVRFAAPA